MRLDHALALVSASLLAGCGGSGTGDLYDPGSPSCSPSATRVCMTASTFNPTTLTVSEGTEVTWLNGDALTHTVTSDPGSPEMFNQTVGAGGTFTHTFSTAGTYEYYCQIHGSPTTGMRGMILVE